MKRMPTWHQAHQVDGTQGTYCMGLKIDGEGESHIPFWLNDFSTHTPEPDK